MDNYNKKILNLTKEKWLLYAIILFLLWNGLYLIFLFASNDIEFLSKNIQLISNIFYVGSIPVNSVCFLIFSTLFIAPKINRFLFDEIQQSHSNHLEKINELLTESKEQNSKDIATIKRNIFKSIYSKNIDAEIFKSLEIELFYNPTVRKNVKIILTLKPYRVGRSKTQFIEEELHWSYELHNKTDKEIEHLIVISTLDKDERCIIDKMQIKDTDNRVINIETKPQLDNEISKHPHVFKIPANSFITITNVYKLKLGMTDVHHRNSIANTEFVIGQTSISIHKPKGYLFTIELFSKHNDFISVPNVENTINEETINYVYDGILYPGQGIEYSLQKR